MDPPPTEIYTYLHTLTLHDALPICPDRRGPGALGDRRENVAALERAWRAVDTTAAFIAGEAALRRKHAVGRIQGGALHTRLDAHVRAPATARDLECACVVVRVLVDIELRVAPDRAQTFRMAGRQIGRAHV